METKKCETCGTESTKRFCRNACYKKYRYDHDPEYREMRLKKSSQSVYKKIHQEQERWVRLRELTPEQVEKINEILAKRNT